MWVGVGVCGTVCSLTYFAMSCQGGKEENLQKIENFMN